MKLTLLDQSQIQQYYYLEESDDCYCLGLYHPRKGFEVGDLNQLIINLKKTPRYQKIKPQSL